MRTLLVSLIDNGWKLGVASVFGYLLVTNFTGDIPTDRIAKMIELDSARTNWCQRYADTEEKLISCTGE